MEEYKVDVEFSCQTPVVGYDIRGLVTVRRVGDPKILEHSTKFRWYQCHQVGDDMKLTSSKKHQKCEGEAAASPRHTSSGEDQTLGVVGSCSSGPSAGASSAFEEGPLLDEVGSKDLEDTSLHEVGSSEYYTPSKDDLGNILILKTVVSDRENGKPFAPPIVKYTNRVISAPIPLPRRMIQIANLEGTGNLILKVWNSIAGTFSVLTYNVLADTSAKGRPFSYCHPWSRVWEYRRKNLLREITEYDADIVCLQEVDSDHFQNFFKPEMVSRGYSVIYKSKDNVMYNNRGLVMDGCATFFRGNKFKEIVKYELDFRQLAQSMIEGLNSDQVTHAHTRLQKGNVAIVVVLEPVENDPISDVLDCRFCVVNVHVHAQVDDTDVKLWQAATLVGGLQRIHESNIPVLLCGDLNSLPGSAVHNLLVKRAVDRSHRDLTSYPNSIVEHMELVHSIPLVSAYSSFLRASSRDPLFETQQEMMDPVFCEPHFTNVRRKFSGTLDYILYSENRLSVRGLLELLNSESARKDIALPSPLWPSDHIALMANFSLMPIERSQARPLPELPWPLVG